MCYIYKRSLIKYYISLFSIIFEMIFALSDLNATLFIIYYNYNFVDWGYDVSNRCRINKWNVNGI